MTRPAPVPVDELRRLQALRALGVLDTPAEKDFDDIVQIASDICDAPIALVSLVDVDRQWFKARVGLDAEETPRDVSFCAHAILNPGRVFEIRDALADERFRDNPLVTGHPGIRFYAGAPLNTSDGASLGTLCVIDGSPRTLSARQRFTLEALARQVVAQLELRQAARILDARNWELESLRSGLEARTLELEAANRRLEEQSRTDPLTGLLNRRGLDDVLAREASRSKRYGHALSLLLLDIDHFKPFNDAHGHVAGDEALASLAQVLREAIRPGDWVARVGGEEFIVVLPHAGGAAAQTVAEQIRERCEHHTWPLEPVTVSIGAASRPAGIQKPGIRHMLTMADEALFAAKRDGRNCVKLAG